MSHVSRARRSLILALGVLAACAAMLLLHNASANASSTQVIHLSAVPKKLMFNTKDLHANAGRVTIEMSNPSNSGISHGIALTGHGVNAVGPIVKPGHVSSITVTVKRGDYTFYCPVPGHEMAGMKGTLVVG